MSIKQTLTAIRKHNLTASYDAGSAEYRIDFRRNDTRHVPGKLGFGSAVATESASVALYAAERMSAANAYPDPAAQRRHLAAIIGA